MPKKVVCPNCLEEVTVEEESSDTKNEMIRVRCRKRTKNAFKKYAEAFSTQEDALLSLLSNINDISIS